MPKPSWYWNRLRAMSTVEVGHRLRHVAQTRVDRARLARERLPGFELPEPLDPVEVPFFFDPARAEAIRATWQRDYPEGLSRLRAEADELLAGRTRVFDRELSWTDVPDWHADLLTGGEWPRRFWSEMQIRNGGVKYVWELARHQHLMTLARAFFLTGELPYGTAACRWLKSWIDENPPYTGIHWTSALELGLRLIAWSWIYRLLRSHAAWTSELEQEFFRLIQLQAEFIRRYPSAHSSANNHLIGEAAGVAVAGLAFPWLADADRWRDWGLSVLAEELPKQCSADGVSLEQTFHYQAFVMDLALQPVLLGRHQARETPVELTERLEAMAGFFYTAMDASGNLPDVGDADDGAALLLGQDPRHPFRSLLATGGVLFNRPEFCRTAGDFDEKSAWLLGPAGRERFQKLAAAGAQRSVVRCQLASDAEGAPAIAESRPVANEGERARSQQFPDGGYTVMRSGEGASEQLLLLDHGPLGYLSIAAHGHADCLSLALHLGGRPVLVDPGTYVYHEQPEWRNYFRGTPAHNTITVDGQHQSVMTGPTMWGRHANGRSLYWTPRPEFDYVAAEHDGYQRLTGRPLHRRSVFHRRDGITFVFDHLLGDGTHDAELNWHLAAGTRVEPAGRGAWEALGDGFRLRLALLADAMVETEVIEGREQPPQGWVSPRFGHRVSAPVLHSYRRAPLPMTWVTVLSPAGASEEEGGGTTLLAATGDLTPRGAVISVEHAAGREVCAHAFVGEGEADAASLSTWLELGEGRFRGRAAYLRLDDAGQLTECCVVDGCELEWDGRVVWRAASGPEDAFIAVREQSGAISEPIEIGS